MMSLDNSLTGGGGGSDRFGEEERESGDRNSAGSRWPEEETFALLKIKTEFRDCSWDDVSRKLTELGYQRSAYKCKEKFLNICKYHKRTKESGRHRGKNYHFFEQLELFDNMSSDHSPSPNGTRPPPTETTNAIRIPRTAMAMDTPMIIQPLEAAQEISTPHSTPKSSSEIMTSTSTSTTSSSGDGNGKKKKKKFANYFERLMKDVLERQEKMQKMFLEVLEKCENDRIAKEEAWKMQELAQLKREQEILAQERAVSKARDEAMVALLKKISEQGTHLQLPEIFLNPSPITQISIPSPPKKIVFRRVKNDSDNTNQVTSSRWPKAEIEALIRLRTELDIKYQDTGPKGPLWEEVSLSMEEIGYNRNAKRCKEKWENINKYFRRMKESNKRRPEDSKTCPYYNLLESIYEKKRKKFDNSGDELKPEDILMQMQKEHMTETVAREDGESENVGQNQEDDGDGEYEEFDEFVANNTSSMTSMQ